MKTLLRIVTLLVLAASARAQMMLEPLEHFPKGTLSIYTPDMRKHDFKIWIADTEPRREQGLMFVKSLPVNQGMFFIFDTPQQIAMWMKNTLIPLDMVFIDVNGRVDSIATNAVPMSETIIHSSGIVISVLELKGGQTAKLNIHAGAVVKVTQ